MCTSLEEYFNLGSQVLWAGLPGTESGNALTDVLYGKVNPSGRLPYTIAKQSSDYPAQVTVAVDSNEIISIPYVEGCVNNLLCIPIIVDFAGTRLMIE